MSNVHSSPYIFVYFSPGWDYNRKKKPLEEIFVNTKAAKLFSQIILSDKPVRIKLLGDSITHGHSGTGYAQNGENFVTSFRRNPDGYCWANLMRDFLAEQYGCQVINNGCSGTFTTFIIEHFDTLVDDEDDLVICTIGTNDRLQTNNAALFTVLLFKAT